MTGAGILPDWARWGGDPLRPWTIGLEEEVMLLDPGDWSLAARIDDVLLALPTGLATSVAAETHASTLELNTRPHASVAGAVHELGGLRGRLTAVLCRLGLRAATAGAHPTARWDDVEVSPGARYQTIHDSMRELARREPTFALHVHVAVPEAEQALRALNRLRAHLPVLLALSANSPFSQGRDTGMASSRIPVFDGFPRVGIPRPFADYAAYVAAIDALLRRDAFPDPTFLWWDARLQPKLGTIEVRIMDAQTHLRDVAALAALVQCVVCMEASAPVAEEEETPAPELLEENRFLAARDGSSALLLDLEREGRRPLAEIVGELLVAGAPHAGALGCADELHQVRELLTVPGACFQRRSAGSADSGGRLRTLTARLSAAFVLGADVPLAA